MNKKKDLKKDEIALIDSWCGPVTPFPHNKTITDLFEDQVKMTPEAIAVQQAEEQLSYRELDQKANRIANYLLQQGLKIEEFVGVNLPRSIDMIVSLLAVMKAGGVYLPLDSAYPRDNLDYILQDANPVFLITNREHKGDLEFRDAKTFVLDELDKELRAQLVSNPDVTIEEDNLAYCLFTSGSTGRSKGVLIEHRSIVNFTLATISNFEIGHNDRMLQFSSPNFDTSLEEIFPALCSGARLVLRTGEMLASLQRFLSHCEEWEISILDLPTAFWHELVIYIEKNVTSCPDSVRLIIIGGERVSPTHLSTWHTLGFDSIRLENTYGLTECTCVVTSGELTPWERKTYADREVTIGRAIDNVKLFVLDDSLQRVPVNVPGELYIGGVCLARGYLKKPELTTERFIKDLFADGADGRLYKTGDVVQWRKNGTLEYLGRVDDQIKVRGYRIEPGQIESVLMDHAQVADAVVIKRVDLTGTDRLVAYLRPEKKTKIDIAKIRALAADKLPDYMLPAFYKVLNEFPLSPNGKIDKKSLPDPNWEQHIGAAAGSKPRTKEEKEMLAIWEDALGRTGIGMQDNFFDIGGHSLLAARMMTEVEEKFGVPIPLVELLEHPTIRDLSAVISEKGWKPTWDSVVNLKNAGNRTALFLIHPIGGDILAYRRLVNRLKSQDRPVYGVRAQGLGGIARPHDKIEAMAAFYLKEIKRIQPVGPYLLGGYSFGGTVAYEMAQQLINAGEKVAFLGMFDTVIVENLPHDLQPSKLFLMMDQIKRIFFMIKKFVGLSIPKKREYLSKIFNMLKGFSKSIITGNKYVNPKQREVERRWQRTPPAFQKVEKNNKKALDDYIARPYAGKITLFKARQREWSEMVNPEPLWKGLIGNNLDVVLCEGNHDTIMVEPYVHSLSVGLKEVLDQLED